MINLANLLSILSFIAATGDDTNLALPAIAAGVGVGAIGVSLFVRKGEKGSTRRKPAKRKSTSVPPTRSRNS